ncbi:MAG: hypothetical protein ACJ79E_12535, partial [Anaeromyxobacteraceae bacterium]
MRRSTPAAAGFESTRRLAKWLVVGSVIGCVAGLGSIVFYGALELASDLLLGRLAGYYPPATAG